jgi:hypothetical protein
LLSNGATLVSKTAAHIDGRPRRCSLTPGAQESGAAPYSGRHHPVRTTLRMEEEYQAREAASVPDVSGVTRREISEAVDPDS